MRLLFLYPEEWSGVLAREMHVLSTCAALAEGGVDVTLVIAGGEANLRQNLFDVADAAELYGLHLVELPRTLGPIQSTSIFSRNFNHWMRGRRFDLAYIIHLKAGPILTQAGVPYVYEARRIFTQGQEQNPARQRTLHKLEGQVLAASTINVATSRALAVALKTWFGLSKEFAIVPGAGMPPLDQSLSAPFGPYVYCGSISEAGDIAAIIQAANDTRLPLKVVGGTEHEWNLISSRFDTSEIVWQPRVPLGELTEILNGSRAGLVPTNADSPLGEFACPMKLFDYARCGLPVISTALPALQNLDVGSWCTQVWCSQISGPARFAWTDALMNFEYNSAEADAARAWAAEHTWAHRAELLKKVMGI